MFTKALVALDLSPAEQPVINCLPALKQWGITHLVLMHVVQLSYPLGAALAREQDYIDWLETHAAPIRDAGISVEVKVQPSGEPACSIVQQASNVEADLLVIGSRGQNMLRRLFLGSVAREVLRTSHIPVLLEWVEPKPEQTAAQCEAVCTNMLQHVVLATDFSAASNQALATFGELTPGAGKVGVIHVGSSDTAEHERQQLDAVADSLSVPATAHLLTGKPSSAIAEFARLNNVTLIVVGKHGQSAVASKLIGSTAANLCEIANRPVLMVP